MFFFAKLVKINFTISHRW